MLVLCRACAVLPAVALALAAPSAQAARITTLPCVGYVAGHRTLPILGSGFTPGGVVRVYTNSAAGPTPRTLTSAQTDALGTVRTSTVPPPFMPPTSNRQTFNLIGYDTTNPAAPILATSRFDVVRFGLTRNPEPRRPRQRITFTASGFRPGRPVYIHFRFAGKTRRTVNLGIAQPPCGIASKRLPALPTKIRYGAWRAYVNQAARFSRRTRPQWVDKFSISRRAG